MEKEIGGKEMKDSVKDVAYAMTKAGIGSVPYVGGVLYELFGLAFNDPATKRRDQVISNIEERLQLLESEGYDIKKLADNEEFLSITMQAYQIAMRTHQLDKRIALMNAIYNTPKLSIDENEKIMYLNYIDQFNEWHLRILMFLNNPRVALEGIKVPEYVMGGKETLLLEAFPELKERRSFYDQIVNDLYNRGVITINSLHGTMTANGMYSSSTTESGKKFIEFITKS